MKKENEAKKIWYCEYCKKYPDEVIELKIKTNAKSRKWDEKNKLYMLTNEQNISENNFICGKCKENVVLSMEWRY